MASKEHAHSSGRSNGIGFRSNDNSTRCDDDFQWFSTNSRPDRPTSPGYVQENKQSPVRAVSPSRSDRQQQQQQPSLIHHQTVTTKPPTSRPPLRTRSDNSPRRQTPEKQTGSLDRRRIHHGNRQERDQKSRSTQDHRSPEEIYFPPPPPRSDLTGSPRGTQTCPCHEFPQDDAPRYDRPWVDERRCEIPFSNEQKYVPRGESPFHRHHERTDPKRYGSSTVLMDCDVHERYHHPRHEFVDHRLIGSHPDLYGIGSDRGHGCGCSRNALRERSVDNCAGCCAYHTLPRMPCCHYGNDLRSYGSWTSSYNKQSDQDDRVRRLETEKESLQLQVSVLTEQIDAQSDKISELEKMLSEKKQMLGNTEELLQRETLSRSSLETQKLELIAAMSELKRQQAALERENLELRTSHYNNNPLGNHVQTSGIRKPPLSRTSPVPQHTSTPIHANQLSISNVSPSPSPVSNTSLSGGPSPIRTDNMQTHHEISQPRTPPASFRRTVDIRYGSLPRQPFPTNGRIDSNANQQSATLGPKKGVAFADTDKMIEDNVDGMSTYSPQQSPSLQINKNKGIKKIFGKMKRSGSGNLEDLPGEGEFRRGGVRATAGPRLGWSEAREPARPEKHFDEWDPDVISEWLHDLGLECYSIDAKRWLKNGAHLRSATVHDLEKELGVKNALHRKKLQLAIIELTDECASDCHLSAAGKLDTAWVLRWLDDTGLPQHKEAFLQGRVDGRMLHRLTIDDLAALHVTSLLHATSLRRGIQVLRERSFDPDCLVRRSTPGEPEKPEPEKVTLWTAHRVMEWLRAVDLAEYAPNLRGAGIHGSLMVYEPKFTAELLATLLNIPPSKTLLRRHLSTHFKELLGREVIQEKREAEATLGYVPLTPAAKLKVAKKSQFSLKRKKSKGEPDYGDLVCPLGSSGGASGAIVQSGELTTANIGSTSHGDASGMTRTIDGRVVAVCHLVDDPALSDEVFHTVNDGTSIPTRIKDSMLV